MQFSHDKATVNSIVDAAYKYQIRGDSDVKSELCIQFIPNDNLIWVNLIYSKPVAWPEIFSEFKKFEPFASINTLSFRSWPDFIAGQPFFEGDTRLVLTRLDLVTLAPSIDPFYISLSYGLQAN